MREGLGEGGPREGPERSAHEDRRDRPPVRPWQRQPASARWRRHAGGAGHGDAVGQAGRGEGTGGG